MTTDQKIIKNKIGLLNLAEELRNVSRACKMMGYSRDSFYRYRKARDEGGWQSLVDESRRKPNLKNRIESEVEERIIALAYELPAYGQVRVANELRKRGIHLTRWSSMRLDPS